MLANEPARRFHQEVSEQALTRGLRLDEEAWRRTMALIELPKAVTYEDFRRINRMEGRPKADPFAIATEGQYEPTFDERRREAAGPWAFVLDLEAAQTRWR